MIYCHVVQLDEVLTFFTERSGKEVRSGGEPLRARCRSAVAHVVPALLSAGGNGRRRRMSHRRGRAAASRFLSLLGRGEPRPCASRDPRARSHRALESQAGASHLSSANAPAVELAEKLLSIVPERARGRVWLGHSGSDANETVARAVVAATGRPRIISFRGAYHGGTTGSMAISGHPVQAGCAKAEGLTLIPYPNAYRDGGPEAAAAAALAHLEDLFAGPVPPEEVAALFLEPIQSDGGMIVPPAGLFQGGGSALPAARHSAGVGRSEGRPRPQRPPALLRASRHRARHRRLRERTWRRTSGVGGGRTRGDHESHGCLLVPDRARQSGICRRGACGARDHRARQARGERGAMSARLDAGAGGAEAEASADRRRARPRPRHRSGVGQGSREQGTGAA